MTRTETIRMLKVLVSIADYYRNASYMTPPANAAERRQEDYRGTVPYFEWSEGGHKFSACYKVQCTISRIYARGVYTRDGKKTTLLAVKNSLKRLEMEENENV